MVKMQNAEPLKEPVENLDIQPIVEEVELPKQKESVSKVDALEKEIAELKKLFMHTADKNKIRSYEIGNSKMGLPKFSISVYPMQEGDAIVEKVVTSWDNMVYNQVSENGKNVRQTVRIHLEDGKKKDIPLTDMSRVLIKKEKIRCTKIINMDGSPLGFRNIVLDNECTVQIMNETTDPSGRFIATIPYKGKEYEICNTFLNA